MPQHYQHIVLRGCTTGHTIERPRVLTTTDLHGVPGFAFHRFGGDLTYWVLSHMGTGARAGKGRTREECYADAIHRGRDRGHVLRAIAGVSRRLENLRKGTEL